ncbi:MAG TPA: ABC transporter ATP-binding protein [Myxococcota bacterium]|nr:ABC transporter ATP-binding protein [Myxococcota bacterium]
MAPYVRAHPEPLPSEAGRDSSDGGPCAGALFEVDHLSVVYPTLRGQSPVPVLEDVSFALARGGSLTLVGSSGSGKSTLLRCLNRLEEPTRGSVRFNGCDIRSIDPRELRQRAALVMQTPVLFDGTIRDNLRLRPIANRLDPSETRLVEALEEVGLPGDFLDRRAETLSVGEKQRVTIARALLTDPDALLLDEPTSALDPPNVALVTEAILRLRQTRALTIVAVTHQTDLVRKLGGYLLYLVRGRVHAYTCMDGVDPSAIVDTRLQAFLAGESASRLDAYEK